VIAVDTSVWIDFFRGRSSIVERLSGLLDRDEVALPVSVKIEILSGARKSEVSQLERVLAALPILYPSISGSCLRNGSRPERPPASALAWAISWSRGWPPCTAAPSGLWTATSREWRAFGW